MWKNLHNYRQMKGLYWRLTSIKVNQSCCFHIFVSKTRAHSSIGCHLRIDTDKIKRTVKVTTSVTIVFAASDQHRAFRRCLGINILAYPSTSLLILQHRCFFHGLWTLCSRFIVDLGNNNFKVWFQECKQRCILISKQQQKAPTWLLSSKTIKNIHRYLHSYRSGHHERDFFVYTLWNGSRTCNSEFQFGQNIYVFVRRTDE